MQHVRLVTDRPELKARFPHSLLLRVADGYHRLIVHGSAQYYGLVSHSEADAADDKVIVIRQRQRQRKQDKGRKRQRRPTVRPLTHHLDSA